MGKARWHLHSGIFWELLSSEEISNLSRTGKAYCFFRNSPVKILQVYSTKSNRNLTNDVSVVPGAIVDFFEDALVVKAVDGCINIQLLESGRRRYSFDKWIRKYRVKIGEKLQ